jgi:CBS domain-containing protein
MDHRTLSISCDAKIIDAVEVLLNAKVSGAAVVDSNNSIVGFVSEQDCITQMLNNSYYHVDTKKVSDVMSHDVVIVTPQTSILELAENMEKNKPRNFPVVLDNKLVGQISRHHILSALVKIDSTPMFS